MQTFIYVRHVKSFAAIGKTYVVDPVKDMRPVCPNCHAVIHSRTPAYRIHCPHHVAFLTLRMAYQNVRGVLEREDPRHEAQTTRIATHAKGVDVMTAPLIKRGPFTGGFTEIVAPASNYDAPTTILCRRRPRRRPCGTPLTLFFDTENFDVLWFCPACDDGRIGEWQGTFWDNSDLPDTETEQVS